MLQTYWPKDLPPLNPVGADEPHTSQKSHGTSPLVAYVLLISHWLMISALDQTVSTREPTEEDYRVQFNVSRCRAPELIFRPHLMGSTYDRGH